MAYIGYDINQGGHVISLPPDNIARLAVAGQDLGPTDWANANAIVNMPANHDAAGAQHHDWRLPTKAELNALYTHRVDIGGFDHNAYYWSAEEAATDPTKAWAQYFGDGLKMGMDKINTESVRAVRTI